MATEDRKFPPFPGDLTEPIRSRPPAVVQLLDDDHPAVQEAMNSEAKRVAEEIRRKFDLLLTYYQVRKDSPDQWQELAFFLARQFIPGFRILPPVASGAPLDWGPLELADLYIEIEALTKQGMTAMDACRFLLRAQDGTWRYPRCRSAKTLYRRYQQSKNSAFVLAMTNQKDESVRQVFRESITETLNESRAEK